MRRCARWRRGREYAAGLALAASACRGAPKSLPAPAPTTEDAAPTRLGRAPTRDVTFLAISDTHFGYVPEAVHVGLVPKIDGIAGRPYPAAIGGTVAPPRGLLITGDLTEWGKEDELSRFLAFYGNAAGDAGVRVPVFEIVGNHDKVHGPWVTDQVALRHGGRWYAWDWDDVHVVALGEAPDDDGLAWLSRDLARIEANVPLVLYFHLPLEGPWSTGNWFGDGDYRARLGALLEGRCVAAIFHGHHHASAHYLWHGIHVYKPGAVKDGAHTFAVTRLAASTITVAYFDYDRDAWGFSHTRDLCGH